VREELGVVPAANDGDQQVVDAGEQQRIENQPELSEERGGVGPAHHGLAHLGGEGPSVPQLADVGDQRWQAGAVRPVVVVDRLELAVALAGGCSHGRLAPLIRPVTEE
jgi:hypothetical protein